MLAPTDAWSPQGMWWDAERAREIRLGQAPDTLAAIGADPRARSRAAKAAYLTAQEHHHRILATMTGLGDRIEAVDSAQTERAYREMLAARQRWWDSAPPVATAWWPGGWRVRTSVGGIQLRLGVWLHRGDAEAFIQAETAGCNPSGVTREAHRLWNAIVEWTPTHADAALDADLWAAHPDGRFVPSP